MKLKSEPLILIAVFGILLFLGFSGLFSSKLNHEILRIIKYQTQLLKSEARF